MKLPLNRKTPPAKPVSDIGSHCRDQLGVQYHFYTIVHVIVYCAIATVVETLITQVLVNFENDMTLYICVMGNVEYVLTEHLSVQLRIVLHHRSIQPR